MESRNVLAIADALDRHQVRREAGLPTVSVLSGPVGLAVREGRRWAEGCVRPVVQVDDSRVEAMVDDWVGCVAVGRDLLADSVARLARRLGLPPQVLGLRLARMTAWERSAFLDSVPPDEAGGDVDAACRRFIEGPRSGEVLAARGLAIARLVPPGKSPVLIAARGLDEPGVPDWLGVAAQSSAFLAMAEPSIATILATDQEELDAYLRLAPESRAKALIREGIVPVSASSGRQAALAALFDRARESPESADRARSAAERFLFERLEEMPETAGLFTLNEALDFPFGPNRAMEVDLASSALKLAVEVDGYHHFRDEDDYRRDRRKDYELQSRGYLVLRVLAEDVVRRLEDVLDSIRAAVARRRDADAPNRGAPP